MDECVSAPWRALGYLILSDSQYTVNDDGDGMSEIFNIFGTMTLTSFEMLSEHGLLGPDSPIPNIGILSLLMIEFLYDTPGDIDSDWAHEIVRALDKASVELHPRKEVGVSAEKIGELRDKHVDKEGEEVDEGKNVYQFHAAVKFWSPDDDYEHGERIWARWDWKKEVCSLDRLHGLSRIGVEDARELTAGSTPSSSATTRAGVSTT